MIACSVGVIACSVGTIIGIDTSGCTSDSGTKYGTGKLVSLEVSTISSSSFSSSGKYGTGRELLVIRKTYWKIPTISIR